MSADEELVAQAKAVIADHERRANAGDLDRIVNNFAQDIVLLAADAPLVVGIDAFREFYGDLLAMGSWEFVHEYVGTEIVGETVVLYGVSRGTLTPEEGENSSFVNNFIITVKRTRDGMKIWRAAFASASE